VLVSAMPAVGHVVPLLGVAGALSEAGHEVRFATNPERHGLIASAGVEPVAAGISASEMSAERRRLWPETDAQPATVWATRMWAQIMGPSMLNDLRRIMLAWPPDVVVHDEGDYASPPAAAEAGIPWITHGWGSPLRPLDELTELTELTSGLWDACGLTVRPAGGLYAHALINPCPPALQARPPGADIVWPISTQPPGNHDTPLTADVYIGFGTVPIFADAADELTAAVQACTAHGLRVVVTAPDQYLREQLQRIDEDLVDARPYVSLAALLPSCKLVICHGGAGTVLAALSAAVPLLITPRGSPSQIRMADACEQAGVARRCRADQLDVAVEKALRDPSLSHAARATSQQIANLPSPAAVTTSIEALVAAENHPTDHR
jgi:UDP:flavonoid glycosyltransferase YjiC (YdhE family)